MAELDTEDREKLDKRRFAYVDKNGEGHLPINDESHVRNAMARWNQTEFESASAKESARRKIVAAAKRHGIEIAEDDKIRSGGSGLRARRTAARRHPERADGPRGGRPRSGAALLPPVRDRQKRGAERDGLRQPFSRCADAAGGIVPARGRRGVSASPHPRSGAPRHFVQHPPLRQACRRDRG